MIRQSLCLSAALLASLATTSSAQAPASAAAAMVSYNTLKNSSRPDSALKVQIDSVDRAIATATRLGQTAEARRQIARGMSLLAHRPWTDADDYRQSLVLRSEHLFADPAMPYSVRLEQLYTPNIELTKSLSARVSIRPATQPGTPAASGATAPIKLVELPSVSRDLRDTPLRMELDLSAVPDGPQVLEVEVLDSARTLGTARLRLTVQKGLDARLAALERQAATAPTSVRADIRYPADVVRKVNHSIIDAGAFNLGKELTAATEVAAEAKGGRDPFAARTGDLKRHYLLAGAGEIMPYRVYVPKSYSTKKPMPLIIALHGLGGNEDSFMDSYAHRLPELAEQRGYIVATPLGYRSDGFYGFPYGNDTAARATQAFSEQDVMEVLAHVREQYKVDDNRIYLMGHSMGAIGTWFIAAKHPELWAALGTFSGLGDAASEERMRRIPQFVVHGDADPTVAVAGSRRMVESMKTLGVDYKYVEVPGGNHVSVVVPNLAAMFDFFDGKTRVSTTVGGK